MLSNDIVELKIYSAQLFQEILHGRFIVKISFHYLENFSRTNPSGTSSVAQGLGHFLLFKAKYFPFVNFCTLAENQSPLTLQDVGGGGGLLGFSMTMHKKSEV